MAHKTIIPKPLVEQILDDMFVSLEAREEFDAQAVQRLRELTQRGGLTKPKQVEKAIEAA